MKILKGWVLPIAIGLLVGLLIKTFVFTVVRVDGISMFPNLQNKELVMEIHHAKIKRDSVIVFDAYGVDKRPDVAKNARYVKNSYFVLGDNRAVSNDSRYYGFVPKDKVNGVAKVPFWNDKKDLINSYDKND